MDIQGRFKTALDETRLLMLGAQIFFGFQFNGIFQTAFESISPLSKILDALALLLMCLTIALLIGPSARHRLADHGHVGRSLILATNRFAGLALFPFSLSFAMDIYIVMARMFGTVSAFAIAAFFWVMAIVFWFWLEVLYRRNVKVTAATAHEFPKAIPLTARIEQMLTEARVILPGAQALLAFQLLAMLTQAFDRLPRISQIVHATALGCVAITVVLLIAPAAFHRITFKGNDSEDFYRIGSRLVTVALFPLALGMTGDIHVAIAKLTANTALASTAAAGTFLTLIVLWYIYPLILRRTIAQRQHSRTELKLPQRP